MACACSHTAIGGRSNSLVTSFSLVISSLWIFLQAMQEDVDAEPVSDFLALSASRNSEAATSAGATLASNQA